MSAVFRLTPPRPPRTVRGPLRGPFPELPMPDATPGQPSVRPEPILRPKYHPWNHRSRDPARLSTFDAIDGADSTFEGWHGLIAYLTDQIVQHLEHVHGERFTTAWLPSRTRGLAHLAGLTERLMAGETIGPADWISVDDAECQLDLSNLDRQDLGAVIGVALAMTWPTGPADLEDWLVAAVRYAGLLPPMAEPAEEALAS